MEQVVEETGAVVEWAQLVAEAHRGDLVLRQAALQGRSKQLAAGAWPHGRVGSREPEKIGGTDKEDGRIMDKKGKTRKKEERCEKKEGKNYKTSTDACMEKRFSFI